MSITSYDTLITAITTTLQDSTLTAEAAQYIQFAEAELSRRLHVHETETSTTFTAASSVALPTDYKGVISIKLDDYAPLKQLSLDDFQTRFAEDTNTGIPEYYAIAGSNILLGPPPESAYTGTIYYWQTLTALAEGNQSNWLLLKHPDLYFYASLIHAEADGWNDERVPLFVEAVDRIIIQINRADMRARRAALAGDVPGDYF